MRLEGKSAVITGAASGIGRAIGLGLAEEGARVIVLDQDEAGARETCTLIGDDTQFVKADLRSITDIDAAFEKIISTMGGVDILVNCAGVMPLTYLKNRHLEEWK